jgi:hypothetical protein
MPTCVICDMPITLRGDYFYGAHIKCAKQAVDYEAQAMDVSRRVATRYVRDEIASAS